MWVGILLGFILCMVLFEAVRKGYFQWVGKSRPTHEIIQNIVKECNNWAVLCQQDKSDFVALVHACYAKGYCEALQHVANERFVYEATGVHLPTLKDDIDKLQENRFQHIASKYPEQMPPKSLFTPPSSYRSPDIQ